MKKIALISLFFDYPENAYPLFYNNAIKYFQTEDIHILRFNDPSKKDKSYYEKLYYYKVIKALEYYETNILNKYEYILFGDAKDTNFYRSPSDIENTFLDFKCDILFCGEKGHWPPIPDKSLYSKKEKLSESFYLNSGLYFGYTEKIVKCMKNIINENRTPYDDQGHWAFEYLLNDNIKVDQNKKMFFSTFESKTEIIQENEKIILPSTPYMVHDNGPYGENTYKIGHLL